MLSTLFLFIIILNNFCILEVNIKKKKKIKLLKSAPDVITNEIYKENSIVDLGEERNKNAVANGIAIWVETEKKEYSTVTKKEVKVKGEKIETK